MSETQQAMDRANALHAPCRDLLFDAQMHAAELSAAIALTERDISRFLSGDSISYSYERPDEKGKVYFDVVAFLLEDIRGHIAKARQNGFYPHLRA